MSWEQLCNQLGSYKNIMEFQVVEMKTSKEIPQSLKLEFLEKILASTYALSDGECKTSGPFIWDVYQIYLCWEHS